MLYGKPRKKFKNCGCKYTSGKKEWKPTPLMFLVVILFLSKMSMRAIARMIKVSPQTIVNWITKFYDKHKDDFPDVSDVREIEIDEMWHYFEKKTTKSGSGKFYVVELEGLLDGYVGIVIKPH